MHHNNALLARQMEHPLLAKATQILTAKAK
jgi:hypothetical protein